MSTNTHLNDALVPKATDYSSAWTNHATISEDLAEKIREYQSQVKVIRKKTTHLRFTKSSLDIIRGDRNRQA